MGPLSCYFSVYGSRAGGYPEGSEFLGLTLILFTIVHASGLRN
jgi:hypothetical protein